MKATGIVRKIDELGRIVLPIEMRNCMDLKNKDSVEIFVDDDKIILRKHVPACIFCGNADNIVFFDDKRICLECLSKLKEL